MGCCVRATVLCTGQRMGASASAACEEGIACIAADIAEVGMVAHRAIVVGAGSMMVRHTVREPCFADHKVMAHMESSRGKQGAAVHSGDMRMGTVRVVVAPAWEDIVRSAVVVVVHAQVVVRILSPTSRSADSRSTIGA